MGELETFVNGNTDRLLKGLLDKLPAYLETPIAVIMAAINPDRFPLEDQVGFAMQLDTQPKMVLSAEDWARLGREPKQTEQGLWLKSVNSMDPSNFYELQQTDGKPLPDSLINYNPNTQNYVTVDDYRNLLSRLGVAASLAEIPVYAEDFSVTKASNSESRGVFRSLYRDIRLNSRYPENQWPYTLLHELSHAFSPGVENARSRIRNLVRGVYEVEAELSAFVLGAGLGIDVRGVYEVEAELSAFVLGAGLGIDGTTKTTEYVFNWSGSDLTGKNFELIVDTTKPVIQSIAGSVAKLIDRV